MDLSENVHESNISQTVVKALNILECLAAAEKGLTAPQVAKEVGMSRPTVYRLLTTLEYKGYVSEIGHEYRLGTKVLNLAGVLLESMNLPRLAEAYLRQVSEISGETAYVSILDGTAILYVSKVESTQSVRSNCALGTRNPLHCTSMGRAILANLPEDERREILDNITFTRFTENTITDRAQLEEELDVIRRRGYAIDNMEIEDGVRCVGAPIFDHTGRAFAAMSLSGPAFRLSIDRLHELSGLVINASQTISRKLGYQPENNRRNGR
ncbi:MAG: IclR family transcriptional regulator [Chloroflexi bacterium]|nr:MAG: IclR family transcriptional regulator [Chloroflexota bacterium]